MTREVIANIIAVVICIISAISYFRKNKHGFLILQVVANILYSIMYVLLGAVSGMIGNSITTVKFFCFYLDAKKGVKTGFKKSLIFCILSVVLGLFGFKDGWFAIIPIVNAIIITYATAQDNPVIMRTCYTVANAGWIVFNYMTRAYISAAYSAFELVVSFVSIFLFIRLMKRTAEARAEDITLEGNTEDK